VEKRCFNRIPVSLEAELISDDKNHAAIVEDISENGLKIIIAPIKHKINFTPEIKLELKLHLPSGEPLNLSCKKKWLYKISAHGSTMRIGIEIIEPPTQYKKFLTTLK
jgi:hypothetical protein